MELYLYLVHVLVITPLAVRSGSHPRFVAACTMQLRCNPCHTSYNAALGRSRLAVPLVQPGSDAVEANTNAVESLLNVFAGIIESVVAINRRAALRVDARLPQRLVPATRGAAYMPCSAGAGASGAGKECVRQSMDQKRWPSWSFSDAPSLSPAPPSDRP